MQREQSGVVASRKPWSRTYQLVANSRRKVEPLKSFDERFRNPSYAGTEYGTGWSRPDIEVQVLCVRDQCYAVFTSADCRAKAIREAEEKAKAAPPRARTPLMWERCAARTPAKRYHSPLRQGVAMRYLLLAAAVAACPGAFAQQSKEPAGDLETLHKIDQLQRGMQAADDLQHLVEKMAAARNMACVKALGAPPFCSCLTENLPIRWTFRDYVAIVTTDKARNDYAKMSADDKKAYEAVPAVRDRCVKQSFGGKQ